MSERFSQFQVDAHNSRVRKENRIPTIEDINIRSDAIKSERELHGQIFDECERLGWLVMHGAMNRRTYRSGGEEDFIIRADGGRVYWIEAKSKSGKLSVDQQAVHAHAAKLGHKSHVIRSISEFYAVVDAKPESISGTKLAAILVRHGIIDPCAVEDAEGYDGGKMLVRVAAAAQEIL